jgi:hypothetical protein
MILHLLLILGVAVWGTIISLWAIRRRSTRGSILALYVGTMFGITLTMVMFVIRSDSPAGGVKIDLDFRSPPTTRNVMPQSPGGVGLSGDDLLHA